MKFIMDTFSPSGKKAGKHKTSREEYSRRVNAVFEGDIEQYRVQVNRFPTSDQERSVPMRRTAPKLPSS